MERDVFRDLDELEPKCWYMEVTFQVPDITVIDEQLSDRIMSLADDLDLGPQFSVDKLESQVALSSFVNGTLKQAAYRGLETTLTIFEAVGLGNAIPIKATMMEEDGEIMSVSSGEYSEDEIADELLRFIHEALARSEEVDDIVEYDLTQTILAMYTEIRQFSPRDIPGITQ